MMCKVGCETKLDKCRSRATQTAKCSKLITCAWFTYSYQSTAPFIAGACRSRLGKFMDFERTSVKSRTEDSG